VKVGHRSREASNPLCAILPQDEVAGTQLIDGAVMLSEALQRNAKHEARLSNISVYFRQWIDPDLIRDSSLRSERHYEMAPTVPRIAPTFAPNQEERAQRSEPRCHRIAVRERDRPDGFLRSKRFRSRESETGSAIAMN
jgi:hypothetical protein